MPELPEVETIVRELTASNLNGIKIKRVKVFWPRSVGNLEVSDFSSKLAGQAILQITRRGKFIVFTLNRDKLLLHLRMTGKLTISKEKAAVSSHERIQLQLEDGRVLHYEDQRKFGKWYLLPDATEKFAELGIEPLSEGFTLKALQTLLKKSRQQIKPFLLNQRYIAGLGNIYVDEALWEAKIHPTTSANALSASQIAALYRAIPMVLEQGIANMGTSLGSKQANYFSVSGRRGGNQTQLKVFRRDKLACPRCGTPLIKMVVAQRGTHLCPHCQQAHQ